MNTKDFHFQDHSHHGHDHLYDSRCSFDSLSSPAQFRSPSKRIAVLHKDNDEKMNFKKWLTCLISIGNMIMSPMICFMGFQASKYGLSKVVADKALIIMGIMIFIMSLFTLIAAIKLKKRILFFLLYSFMVIFVFLAIFTLGIFNFTPDIKQYVYDNWGEIRPNAKNFNFDQFENNLRKDITSLGVFSVTIMVGIFICMYAIVRLLTLKRIMKSILPPISLLVIVFSSALVMIAIFSGRSASYVNLPTYLNEIAVALGLFLVLTGFLGYYAAVKNIKKLLMFYLAVMVVMFLVSLGAAFGYFKLSSTFVETIEQDWPSIYDNLLRKGYNISKIVFMDYILLNFKFAGLYGLMYCFFVFLAIVCTAVKINLLREAEKLK